MDDRGPSTLKKWPARPEDHGGGEGALYPPKAWNLLDGVAGENVRDHDGEQRNGERESCDQTAHHGRSSGLSLFAVTVRGSSAMPHRGQAPGPCCTICGCIGQVYSRCFEARWPVGSRAMPHFGQGPGFEESTSGCMGQVYCADAVVLGAAAMGISRGGRTVVGGRVRFEFLRASLAAKVPGATGMVEGGGGL